MGRVGASTLKFAGLILLTAGLLSSQDWKTATTLPSVDLSGLTAAQTQTVLKLLREHGCTCGCDMKIAECRMLDPNCGFSRGLAGVIVDAVRKGHTGTEAWAAASASVFAHPPKRDDRILSDPVVIPTAGSPVAGSANGRVTLVEFSDFQCPYCALAVPQLRRVLAAFPADVKLIYKEFPLDIHSQAATAAAAAIAAHKQGKFWPLHDAMYADRTHLSRPVILAMATRLGLDMVRFQTDLNAPETRKIVDRDIADGERAGVEGTPTVFLNGRRYNGSITFEALKPLIDAELKKATTTAKR